MSNEIHTQSSFLYYELNSFVLQSKQKILIGSDKIRSKQISSLSISFIGAENIPAMQKKRDEKRNTSHEKVCGSSRLDGVSLVNREARGFGF